VRQADEIFTIPQAADFCFVTRMTMWRWVKSGLLKVSVTPGGHHRILNEDLESFLIQNEMSPLAQKHFPRNKILIVDDDPVVRKALDQLVSAHKYETQTAGDGLEAGVKVMQFKPDLIILDLVMPRMDGFEACKYLKRDPTIPHTKILVLTGYDTEENREQAVAAGADDFLAKPVEEGTLIRHIERLLGRQNKYQLKKFAAKQAG
jgi:CheY-like chemotaxis protein